MNTPTITEKVTIVIEFDINRLQGFIFPDWQKKILGKQIADTLNQANMVTETHQGEWGCGVKLENIIAI